MSLQGLQELWPAFRDEVDGFYETVGQRLRDGAPLDPEPWLGLEESLRRALELSEQMSSEAEGAVEQGEDYQTVSLLVLAAATIDVMLASDISALDPALGEYRPRAILEGETNFLDVDAARQEVLVSADRLFGAGPTLGAQSIPDLRTLILEVDGVTDDLVNHAVACGGEMVKGLFSLAGGAIASVVPHVDLIPRLDKAAPDIVSHAPRFCREYVRKLLALMNPQEPEAFVNQVGGVLAKIAPRSILSRVANVPEAKRQTYAWIGYVREVVQGDADQLMSDLAGLERAYRGQTKWLGRGATWLRRGAGPLSHLLTPYGPAIIGGIFVLGFAYDAYSLTDYLDARTLVKPADLVVGVVPRVRELPRR